MRSKFFSGSCWLLILVVLNASCSPKNVSTRYYNEHEAALNTIEQAYKTSYDQHAFSLVFTDKGFTRLSLEIITDTLTYVYQFGVHEKRLTDTLTKYLLNTTCITAMITQMKAIGCIWINSFDYYVDESRKSMVLISIKPKALHSPLSYKKYYILGFFSQPQYYDPSGRLLVKRKLKKIHKINGDTFRRINDNVCYTVSGSFR